MRHRLFFPPEELEAKDDASTADKGKETSHNPKEVARNLPDAPKDGPSLAKKAPAGETADAVTDDEEWVEIDKESIPKKASVEDVEDEEDKPKV